MGKTVTLEEILNLTRRLSLVEKVRLIERLAPEMERELNAARSGQRKSLRGLWKGLDITAEDLHEARRDMWSGFPREEI